MSNGIERRKLEIAILEDLLIKGFDTFSHQQQDLGDRFDMYGNGGIAAKVNPNIILGSGISIFSAETYVGLIENEEIKLEACSPILYLCDRYFMDIPPIDSQRIVFLLRDWDEFARIITEPTWFPVVLTLPDVTIADLLQAPITVELLRAVLDSGDERIIWRQKNAPYWERASRFVDEMSKKETILSGADGPDGHGSLAGMVEKVEEPSTRAGAGKDRQASQEEGE